MEIPFTSGVTEFDTYFANPARVFAQSGDGGTNNWQSTFSFSPPLTGTVDFDLGALPREQGRPLEPIPEGGHLPDPR